MAIEKVAEAQQSHGRKQQGSSGGEWVVGCGWQYLCSKLQRYCAQTRARELMGFVSKDLYRKTGVNLAKAESFMHTLTPLNDHNCRLRLHGASLPECYA